MTRRGRVLARDTRGVLVRTPEGDIWCADAGQARPGDWVSLDARDDPEGRDRVVVVRAAGGGDFPGPDTETARMSPTRRRNLETRARVMAEMRAVFAERGFLEVDTPVLVRAPGLEVHVEPVSGGGHFLITSPEFQMKRLLCAGFSRIYTVCKSFRAREHGPQHSSEFTMLEWYRAFSSIEDILEDTEALVARVTVATRGESRLPAPRSMPGREPAREPAREPDRTPDKEPDREIDVTPPWIRMTVAQAMERFAGVLLEGGEDAPLLAARVRDAGIDLGKAEFWDDIFYTAFVSRVEPALARMDRPVVLMDWPSQLAALARRKPDDPRWVERFEAYIGGVELCNAYGELIDAHEQRARFQADLSTRRARGLPDDYPLDQRFLAALDEGLPPSSGIALGVDRLLMLLTGADHIRDVLAFTWDEL